MYIYPEDWENHRRDEEEELNAQGNLPRSTATDKTNWQSRFYSKKFRFSIIIGLIFFIILYYNWFDIFIIILSTQ